MAEKLPRVLQNIFGENAMNGKKIAQFGSVIAGAPFYTGDIAQIQALQYWQNGWVGATISDKRYPTSEETTGINKVVTQQIAYLLQKGIPEWLNTETYFINSFCQREGVVYKSATDNNINNDPLTDSGTNWQVFRGASVDSDLEIIMPYTKKAIVNSTLTITNNTLESEDMPYINNGASNDGTDFAGFSDSAWIMISSTFPSNITNSTTFIFETSTPSIAQTIFGNNAENCIGLRDGFIAFILNGVIYKGTTEIVANQRYQVILSHSTSGYELSLANSDGTNSNVEVTVVAPFNAWAGMSMFIGSSPNQAEFYLRGKVKNDLYINIDTDTRYYSANTALSSTVRYLILNGQVSAWCPNGRKAEDNTLNNSVQTFTFSDYPILSQEEKDIYCFLPDSTLGLGTTFDETETPEDAVNGDIWYNSNANTYQRIVTRNPNIFNRGCAIDSGSVTGFSTTNFLQLEGVYNLTKSWSLTLNITEVPQDEFIGFAGAERYGEGFALHTTWAIDHIAYGVQKEQYSNEDGVIASIGTVDINSNGDATGFTSNTNYLTLTPSQTYTSGAWYDIWCITLNTLVADAVLVGGTDNTYNGYLLKINELGQISLSVTFNSASWGINNLVSATGVITANVKTFIKVEFTNNQYIVRVSTDSQAWSTVISTNNTSTMQLTYPLLLGGGGAVAIDGILHLRQCLKYFNSQTVWTGNVFTYGFVQKGGVNNAFIAADTQVYQDSDFKTPLAQATGSDFYYNTSHDQQINSTTEKSIAAILWRDPIQRVYKQIQEGMSYGVAYQGATGYVAVEGLIGSFVPSGEIIYSDANLTTTIDTANGSNYVYLGQSYPIYTYQYGYAKTNGEENQYLSSGTLVYGDANATNTIATASGTDFMYIDEFSNSMIGLLRVKKTQTEQSITLSWDGSTYSLSAEGESSTLSSSDALTKEIIIYLGVTKPDSINTQFLHNCTLNLNTSTFSFWQWNGVSNPTSYWTQFIGSKIGRLEEWIGYADYPTILNSGEGKGTIPVIQIDASNNLPVEIENVCVVANINNLNSQLIPNNTLILGYGGYI